MLAYVVTPYPAEKSSETGKQTDSVARKWRALVFNLSRCSMWGLCPILAARIDGCDWQSRPPPRPRTAPHGIGVRISQIAQNMPHHKTPVTGGREEEEPGMRYGMIDKLACEFHVFFGRQALRPPPARQERTVDVYANLR